ncbi:hypothetical protein L1987_01077 [Smallanthus sonchifolius]|uniref:Uncharacterized protein n=1 Tax=Smallanthus sonchifolius TaxID=185202 RepID=A0ACB9K421_9ASTR|nr:hypothetical protein L1987_01077 [Smallanthus sonchifolius]
MLKQILSTIAALSKPLTSSNPMGEKIPTDATKKGENKLVRNDMENLETVEAQDMQNKIINIFKETLKRKVEALYRQVPKRVRVESDQHSIGQHQAPLETEISKPLHASAEPIFTSVATKSSSAATELLNKEKAKGKMPVIEEEEVHEDIS